MYTTGKMCDIYIQRIVSFAKYCNECLYILFSSVIRFPTFNDFNVNVTV